ncbi:hypothetical protein CL655_00695 [bacterium]|nr:hypothetical protein [bacterium]|tara:strand:+ start:2737 stop:3132 length:396 start_codon:yes stop_codon:yes gene_type:complete
MQTIREWGATIKNWINDDFIFTCMVLLLVAVAAFGLGRWSVLESTSQVAERPVLVPTPVEAPAAVAVTQGSVAGQNAVIIGQFVASVNGTKFHALSCPGAKQISEQNKIYFKTQDEARAAGYTPAANCPGL